MDTKERHVRENESKEKRDDAYLDEIANGIRADGRARKNNGVKRTNSLWLWLGVIILVFILFWWLYSIGTFEALSGVANG